MAPWPRLPQRRSVARNRGPYEADNLVPHYLAHDQYGPLIAEFAADTTNFFKSTGVIR